MGLIAGLRDLMIRMAPESKPMGWEYDLAPSGLRTYEDYESFYNRYEAANPGNPDRALIPAFVRDARFDANSFTRWELSRKIRYHRRNLWLLQALEREFKKWTVGPNGLQIIPFSSDKDWNKNMLESYLEWCESPCLDSTGTMIHAHQLIAAEHHIESEVFINLTYLKMNGMQSKPAIQLIESHRCSTPGLEYSYRDQDGIVDGVQLGRDSNGKLVKPIGYWVREGVKENGYEGDEWKFRSVDDMHHVFDTSRTGMYRDITPYHTTLNTLTDLNDLEQMEMNRAKQNSENANVLTNPLGEMDRTMLRRSQVGFGNTNTMTGAPSTPLDQELDRRQNQYRRILGARTLILRNGEKLEQVGNLNPSAATQWYWRYKIGQVCSASGVPLILIFPELIETMQGTAIRGILDNAHESFNSKFVLFRDAALCMFYFFQEWAVRNDKRCKNPPADYRNAHVIPPRAVNVDSGNNSAAKIAEYQIGITPLDEIAAQKGTTAEILIRRKAANVKMIHDVAEEMGIEPAEISAPIADIGQKLAQADNQRAMAEAGGQRQEN